MRGVKRRAPRTDGSLMHFASPPDEKCGLVFCREGPRRPTRIVLELIRGNAPTALSRAGYVTRAWPRIVLARTWRHSTFVILTVIKSPPIIFLDYHRNPSPPRIHAYSRTSLRAQQIIEHPYRDSKPSRVLRQASMTGEYEFGRDLLDDQRSTTRSKRGLHESTTANPDHCR